jgi:energy-coupling factor transporter ATP-binding protein EcfA2
LTNPPQPRLLSFTLDGWPVLGGSVSVSLSDGVAVLVGRNGAGKSAILEGFEAIALRAIGRSSRIIDGSIPRILNIEVLTPTERRLAYRYELTPLSNSIDDQDIDDTTNNLEESLFSWNDCCQYADGEEEWLWTSDNGVTTFKDEHGESINIFGGANTNSLQQSNLPANTPGKLPGEMQWVYASLRGVRLLGKSPVRQTFKRRPSFLEAMRKGRAINFFELADSLTLAILRRAERGEFDELERICQRVGLGNKITVQKFVLSGEPREKIADEEYISSVLLDGINLGLLSDGTLRVLSILIEIITSPPSATTIIEEPETQIHPGMLAKLLNEISAYTFGENLILSTHSPQVVTWTSPDKINLVYRDDDRTNVRKLSEDDIQQVVEYLHEEGSLGEWLYSGILDE